MSCRNCNEMGHFARDCPHPKRPVESVCYNCGEVCGSLAKECTKPPSAEALARRQSQICYNCGEACGNLAKDCTKPPQTATRGSGWRGRGGTNHHQSYGGRAPAYGGRSGGHHQKYHHHTQGGSSDQFTGPPGTYGGVRPELPFGGGQSRNGAPCYNCQQFGHMSRDCPQPQRPHGTCFKCNQTGHLAKDCPNQAVFPFSGTAAPAMSAATTVVATPNSGATVAVVGVVDPTFIQQPAPPPTAES